MTTHKTPSSVNTVGIRSEGLRDDPIFASAVLNTVGALVVVLDPHGAILYFNRMCEEITGYSSAEVVGRSVMDFLIPPEDLPSVKNVFKRLIEGEHPVVHENDWVCKGGSRCTIAWSNTILRTEAGDVSYIIATGVDLTELRSALNALRKSEAKNTALLHAIPDLMFQINREGYFVDYSATSANDLLMAPAQFLGKNIREVLPLELAELTLDRLQAALDTGEVQIFEYKLQIGNTEKVFESRLTVCAENEVLSIVRDITERKQAELALRRHDAIFQAVSLAGRRFLETNNWEDHIEELLANLGQVAEVSRVYIFENHAGQGGELLTSQRYEWVEPGIHPEIQNPAMQNVTYAAMGMEGLRHVLGQGENFYGHVRDFPQTEREFLQSQSIHSILVVPIFVDGEWWGMIGFDECKFEREWGSTEQEALEAVAGIVGTVIERSRVARVLLSTLEISDAAHMASSLNELYGAIHSIISRLMPANNFYIAIYDAESERLSFPYFVDEVDVVEPPRELRRGLTEYVMRTGQPALVHPELLDSLIAAGEVEQVGLRAVDWLGVPLVVQERTIGVLAVQTYSPDLRLRVAHKNILGFVSNQVAMAIERKRAEAALQRQLQELGVLNAVAQIGASAADEDELIDRTTQVIGEMLYPDNFGVLLVDTAGEVLYFHRSYRNVPYPYRDLRIPLGNGITGQVAQTGGSMRVADTLNEPVYREYFFAARSEVCVPVKVDERVLGVINAESARVDRFTEADERLLSTLAGTLASAIERRRGVEALRASEEQYRSLVETSQDAIMLASLDGRVLLANQQAAKQHGYDSADEIIGQDGYALIDLSETVLTPDSILETLVRGSLRDVELSGQRRDGTRFPLEVSANLICDPSGHPKAFLGISRDITQRKRRESEREAIIQMAAALRKAHERAEMPPAVLECVMSLLNAEGAVLVACDAGEWPVIEYALGKWASLAGTRAQSPESVVGKVLARGQPYHTNDAYSDPASAGTSSVPLRAVAAVPLITQGQVIGVVCVGRTVNLSEDDFRILAAVADMAANALHRATLNEQTHRRLQRLAALRAIDIAISSSLDLRVSLNVLLDHLTMQLNVDAASIFLFNVHTRSLAYAAGRGFRTNTINRSRLRLGDGPAGNAVLNRQTVLIRSLSDEAPDFIPSRLLGSEGFVSYASVPLVAKGQLKGLLEVFERTPLKPDAEWLEFFEMIGGQAAIAVDNASLFDDLQRSNMELALAYDTTLEGWVHALDMRDRETEGHTQRVTEMSLRLARSMGKSENELVHVRRGVLLHDIGKIAIPDSILQKPGPLTEHEWEIMRRHPVYAFDLLAPISYLQPAIDIPYCHHERWDGSGYPRALKGEQIPLMARVFAVVDVWDALRSDRPYRKGWSAEKVYEYISQQAGQQFDPEIVRLFLPMIEE